MNINITGKMAALVLTVTVTAATVLGFCGGIVAGNGGEDRNASSMALTSADLSEVEDGISFDGILYGTTEQSNLFEEGTSFMAEADANESAVLTVPQIATRAADSVVEITTESVNTDRMMRQYITEGAGSGVIIRSDGYIVTNNHVIDGANKIMVRLKNGVSYNAVLVGTDSTTDLAVIKIDGSGLKAATFGSSAQLKVGELAVAIGNPLGELGGTVTDGIISALDRNIVIDGKTMNLLQTNAAVNPGNSGGGLFDEHGNLVGIVVAKSSGSDVEGLAFAIPVDDARLVINELLSNGYVRGRIDLEMNLIDIGSRQTALLYGLTQPGVYVQSVDQQSNAAQAGLRSADRIVAIGSTPVTSIADVTKALASYSVGDQVTFSVIRNNIKYDLSFVLKEYKPN